MDGARKSPAPLLERTDSFLYSPQHALFVCAIKRQPTLQLRSAALNAPRAPSIHDSAVRRINLPSRMTECMSLLPRPAHESEGLCFCTSPMRLRPLDPCRRQHRALPVPRCRHFEHSNLPRHPSECQMSSSPLFDVLSPPRGL